MYTADDFKKVAEKRSGENAKNWVEEVLTAAMYEAEAGYFSTKITLPYTIDWEEAEKVFLTLGFKTKRYTNDDGVISFLSIGINDETDYNSLGFGSCAKFWTLCCT